MAASEILVKFKTAVEPACTLASLGNGAGRICAVIDNSATRASRGILALKFKTGTSPTVSSPVRVYLVRQSNASTNVKGGGGGLGDIDAAVTGEPTACPVVASVAVSASSNISYSELFMVYDPGPKFSFVVWNATSVALNATADTPAVQWLPIVDEAQ